MVATYSGLTAEQRTFYELTLLEMAKKNLPHAAFGQLGISTTIPKNQGMTISWRRFNALSPATTPLTEGTTPAGSDISVTSLTAAVQMYGDFVKFTDVLQTAGIDPVVVQLSEVLGYQAGLTVDTLARDALVADLTQIYAGDATSINTIDAADVLAPDDILQALAIIKGNDGRPFSNGRYVVILGPKAEYDLLQDATFRDELKDAYVRGEENPVVSGYIGTWMGADFYLTSNVYSSTNTLGVNVYRTIVLARDAFGVGGLAAFMPRATQLKDGPNTGTTVRPVSLIIRNPTPEDSDPLAMRGSVGWKTTFVAKVLNPGWGVVINHASVLG